MPTIETNRKKIITRLEAEGWVLLRHGAGHDLYTKPGFPPVQVPRHRTLSPGVARSISKAAGWH